MRIVVLSEWQCRYVYAPMVAGIEGVGVLDVEDAEVEVEVARVVDEVVLTWADEDEVLVMLVPVVDDELLLGEREYRLSP